MNSADWFKIQLTGKQAHGAMPWTGADPITAGAYVITGLQTLISRRANQLKGMGVVSVGNIQAGTAGNIIPETLTMGGTIRSNEASIRKQLTEEFPHLVDKTAEAQNVNAEVKLAELAPVTMNNKDMTLALAPALQRATDGKATQVSVNQAASEDFGYYGQKIPALFVFLGATPSDQDMKTAVSNHNPGFVVDESTLEIGVRAHAEFVLEYAKHAGQFKVDFIP